MLHQRLNIGDCMSAKDLKEMLVTKITTKAISAAKSKETLLQKFDLFNSIVPEASRAVAFYKDELEAEGDDDAGILNIKKKLREQLVALGSILDLQKIWFQLTDKENYNKIAAKASSIVNGFGLLGMIINFLKSLFGQGSSISEAPINLREKKYSKYSNLFDEVSKYHKSFNRHYRELVESNCSDRQILQRFFKLIENDSEIINSKKMYYVLFVRAEKALLGDSKIITQEGIGAELAARVGKNFTNLLDTLKVIKKDEELNADEILEKEEQIRTLKQIIEKLVENIKNKELLLEKCKLKESKLEIYNQILNYKRKLYSFVLRADAWSNGETLSNAKVFDVKYIEKQFDKLPKADSLRDDGAAIELTEKTQNKGILKLFHKSSDTPQNAQLNKLINEYSFNETIGNVIDEKSQEILAGLKTIIRMLKKIDRIRSKLTNTKDSLTRIDGELRDMLGFQPTREYINMKLRLNSLQVELDEIQGYKDDVLLRIGSFLCKALYIKKVYPVWADGGPLPKDLSVKTLDFVKEIYPTIDNLNLDKLKKGVSDEYRSYVKNIHRDNSAEVLAYLKDLKFEMLDFIEDVKETKESLEHLQKVSSYENEAYALRTAHAAPAARMGTPAVVPS